MGFFDRFRRPAFSPDGTIPVPVTVYAAATGAVVQMEEIPDPAFATGALGYAVGIAPTEGIVCSPIDGIVTMLSSSRHAIGIRSVNGAEVLIHIGVDTVKMQGDGFTAKVLEGTQVSRGQEILTVDLDKVHAAGYPDVIITAITNSDEFRTVELLSTTSVKAGDDLVTVRR